MSNAPSRANAGPEPRTDRLRPWVAALSSALLHVALLWIAMLSSPIPITPPEGSDAGGSTVQADFIGETPPTPVPIPSPRPPSPDTPAQPQPVTPLVQPPPIDRAEDPVLAQATARAAAPESSPGTPPPTHRRARTWGQPPGMAQQEHAPVNAGPARSPSIQSGRTRGASSGPSLEVGGYHVYYDLFSENRLRAWRDEGMTELFLPLPGTRQYMVCPLEVALRRGSGECRLVEPDDPELANIGDARQVINMQQIYRRGELLWRGPRPYR